MRLAIGVLGWVACSTTAAAQSAAAVPTDLVGLVLACDGSASWTQTITDDNNTIGHFEDDRTTHHERTGSGRVQVRFDSEGAAMKVPVTLPGGRRDWFKIKGTLQVSDDTIALRGRGVFGQHDIFKIDRRSGDIEARLSGATFAGHCEKAESLPDERKF